MERPFIDKNIVNNEFNKPINYKELNEKLEIIKNELVEIEEEDKKLREKYNLDKMKE